MRYLFMLLNLKLFNKNARLCLAFTLLILGGCERFNSTPCAWNDANCGMKMRDAHPIRSADTWQNMLRKPLADRVAVGDAAFVIFTALDNIAGGYPDKPRLAKPTDSLVREVREVLAELPPGIQKKLVPKLAAVMFVENFGGTGLTQYVIDKAGIPVGAFIVLDPVALESRTANSWATWKENTPFKSSGQHKLVATIENSEGNTRKNTIRYILLHEIAHVLSVGENFHPSWSIQNVSQKELTAYPFASISWLSLENRRNVRSKFDAVLPQRKEIVYYFGARLDAIAANDIYRQLQNTSFPTLYAATNWGDDFAESFANYVHVVLAKRPFEILVEQDGATLLKYGACWEETRCQDKRKLLEAYLRE
jgi:hypothetical protein